MKRTQSTLLIPLLLVFASSASLGKSLETLKKECNKGNAVSCTDVGREIQKTSNDEKALSASRSFFKKGCAKGDGRACTILATHYMLGLGINKSKETARVHCTKGCELNDGTACFNLAQMYLLGEGGLEQDSMKAIALHEKGCKLKEAAACFNLGFLYGRGEEVEKSDRKANEYYELSCTYGNAEACRRAILYQMAKPKADKEKVFSLLKQGCKNGEKEACKEYKKWEKRI